MKHIFLMTIIGCCTFLFLQPLNAQTDAQMASGVPDAKNEHLIGNARDLTVSSGHFYDAGGKTGVAGSDYAITTLHAATECLEIYFEELNLPAGAELRIYLGKDINAPLFGKFRSGEKIWNIKASHITFEYIPNPTRTAIGTGWKALITEVSCTASGAKTTWPESDCPFAIPLCANTTVITGLEQYTDLGNVDDDDGSCYAGTGTGGSVWYSFTPQSAGPLDFSIAPSGTTDYDFVLWDITEGCASGQRDQISCNYSMYSGPTGLSDANCSISEGDDTGNCGTDSKGSSYNRWNRRVNVDPTHMYAICVNFYSGQNHGFTLTFSNQAGSVMITDNTMPTILNTNPNSCASATSLHIDFSEWINCASIGDNANEFVIPGYTLTVANTYCNNGRTNHLDLNVSPGLSTGDYTLTITNITDFCGNVMNDNMLIHIGVPVAEAGADQSVCESRVINLFGSYDYTYNPGATTLTATGGGTYTWSNGGNTQSINVEPSTTTTYVVTANIGGCTHSDNVTVSVVGVNAGSDRSVCTGQSTTLTSSPALSYQWYTNPNVLFGTNGTSFGGNNQSVTVNPTSTTVYRVIGTTASGCQSTWDMRVNVLAANVPVVVGGTICQGSGASTTLTASGYDTYTWTPGGSGPVITVAPATTSNYTVNATALSGCAGSNIVTVYVVASPTASVVATPASTCQGSPVSLATTVPASISLFSQDFESGNNLTLKNAPNCNFLSAGNKWIRGTDSKCTGSYALFISDDNSGYGYNAMCTSVSHAYFDVTIPSCMTNVRLTFNYKSDGDATDKLQVWCTPSLFIPTANTVIDATSGGAQLGSNMYNVGSCTAANLDLTAYAGQTQRIIFQWNNSNMFAGDPPALIDDIAVTATPSYSYSWTSSPAGFTSTTQNPTATPTVNTTYNLSVTRCDGCATSTSAAVTIAPITVTASAVDPNLCSGESTTLNAGGANGYTWMPGNLSGASISVQPGGTTTYTVTGTSGSCTDDNTVTVNVSTPANATITPAGPFCQDASAVNLSAATAGGTWTGTGITNGSLGTFNPATAGAGSHQIIYSIATGCGGADTTFISVTSASDATITAAGPYCTSSSPINLVAANGGGTWTGPGITNGSLGTFAPATAGAGNHLITYTIPGTCGDIDTAFINVVAQANATITPAGPFCQDASATNLSAAQAGGTWTGTGITNGSLGTFDPASAGVGSHQIIYTIGGACGNSDTINVAVTTAADATIIPTGPYCVVGSTDTLTALNGGGTWTGPGITNGAFGIFSPLSAGVGNHQIIYTIPGSCGDIDTVTLNVVAAPDATITPSTPLCVLGSPINLSAATGGGTWTGTGITDVNLGTFNPANTGVGTFDVVYTINGTCISTDTMSITVVSIINATITPAGPYCSTASPVNLTAANTGGSWSGTGITSSGLGTFNPSTAGAGNHDIIYTISGSCGNSDTITITVNASVNADITASGPYCISDAQVNLSAVDPGGVWSGTGITSPASGTFNPSTAGAGTHIITYGISGACGDTATESIVVTDLLDASIAPVSPVCSNIPAFNLTAQDPGGVWAGTGISNTTTGTFSAALAGEGTHQVIYTISGSCGSADTISVTVYESPAINVNSIPVTCIDSTNGFAFLSVSGGLAPYTVNWSTGAQTDTIVELAPGTYTVLISDSRGCSVSSNVSVGGSGEPCETVPPVLYVPNVFSPNGDNINDVLYVRGQGVKSMLFIIYDRWGEKVFESSDLNDGWDGSFKGKPMESAVYVWSLKVTTSLDETINWKGNVTLVK